MNKKGHKRILRKRFDPQKRGKEGRVRRMSRHSNTNKTAEEKPDRREVGCNLCRRSQGRREKRAWHDRCRLSRQSGNTRKTNLNSLKEKKGKLSHLPRKMTLVRKKGGKGGRCLTGTKTRRKKRPPQVGGDIVDPERVKERDHRVERKKCLCEKKETIRFAKAAVPPEGRNPRQCCSQKKKTGGRRTRTLQ